MMSAEENKAIVRRFYDEFFNKGNLQTVNELHTSIINIMTPMPPIQGVGLRVTSDAILSS
ncbi:MAG: hypothetical protein ACLP5H_29465 [Desulfomonilaceae bacterium]